ncbi:MULTISPECIES: DUF4244 domain-containing protein [unclassified Streptomyces]|uniref:DUF4244 domain-containing protein n=1 Tax=unclassified Streptomyces TaxID=2593676 RepID=UPI000F457D92|nr:DUF4244 domain-containing protein [Streptomyces sp. I6]RNL74210.1 DUF4244 domain-containing protein [Streptomyces sp. I6]
MGMNDLRAWTPGCTGKRLVDIVCTRVVSRTRGILTRARDRRSHGDAGMTTSEYAMGTIAACAFAAVLYQVITSETVSGALESIIGKALSAQF